MKRVLILHTGGTLGMAPSGDRALAPDRFQRALVEQVPELAALAEIETRILYQLDSSDVGPEEWGALARAIAEARAGSDGIVVVHGTDTMAYTASALSFALVGLDRPVVLTGSQRPLGEVRTDARRNLVDAVDLACRDIPEVGVCFDGRLLRGNRCTKGDAWSYAAFASPACPPLARLGLDVEIAAHVRRPSLPFSCEPEFDPRIAVVSVVPGMDPRLLDAIVERGDTRGIVLAAFGVGNVPVKTRPLAPSVRRAVEAGITVLVITQARSGSVDLSLYENGAALAQAGALSGGDLLLEAATVKLMHALALTPDDPAARARYLARDVAGERGDDAHHLRD
jgi:L-asparaginase